MDGRTFVLFPPPLDAVPLTHRQYFGPGNTGGRPDIDPDRRFDMPLSLVRRWVEEMVAVTVERFAYRYVSGGSSVAGQIPDPGFVVAPEPILQHEEVQEQIEYEEFGDEWDAARSDVSDEA